MTEPTAPRRGGQLVAVALVLVLVAAAASARRGEDANPPREAAGWYGAASLYRSLAMWAGKRAMHAELHYWKAVQP